MKLFKEDRKDMQLEIFNEEARMLNLKEASRWATDYIKRDVTASNISYLIQYGRIKKHSDNGSLLIDREELKNYYDSMTK
ncbi:MAG: hypothetical protein P9X26_09725, partial [Candidatus Stygibacter frigidus]|nr:hypothetical protein [Candidatus Stygibacter frigidus]